MRQTPLLCSAAIGFVAVALTILSFFGVIVLNVQQLAQHWSREIQVVAYLEMVPETAVLEGWLKELTEYPEIESVDFVSKDEAYRRFRERLGQDGDLLEGIGAEALPASLEIHLFEDFRNRRGINAVVEKLRQQGHFSDLHFGQEWLERFESFLNLIRVGGSVLAGFLLFAALFIISNTIKLTMYARRDELEIMALVGGTRMFIKAPFLLEGALQGMAGGILALGVTFAMYLAFLDKSLQAVLLTVGRHGITFLALPYQLGLVGLGLVLGFIGSLVALRKFVRI